MRKKKSLPKVGSIQQIREKRYRHYVHLGKITAVFDDLIQFYGVKHRDGLGYYEMNIEDEPCDFIEITSEKLKFSVEQSLREMTSAKLKSEIKFKEAESLLQEAKTQCAEVLGFCI